MLNIFTLENGKLAGIRPDEVAVRKPVWVDAIAPSEEEREWVASAFSVALPQPEHRFRHPSIAASSEKLAPLSRAGSAGHFGHAM